MYVCTDVDAKLLMFVDNLDCHRQINAKSNRQDCLHYWTNKSETKMTASVLKQDPNT